MIEFDYNDDVLRRLGERLRPILNEELEQSAHDVMDRFAVKFKLNRLQRRTETSIGPRTGALAKSFTTDVKRKHNAIEGRAFFRGGAKLQTVAQTQEFGATIRPKRGKYLKFKLFRKYSRGEWDFEEPNLFSAQETASEQWIQTKQVVVPARMHFFDDWNAHEEDAYVLVEAGITRAADRLNAEMSR